MELVILYLIEAAILTAAMIVLQVPLITGAGRLGACVLKLFER